MGEAARAGQGWSRMCGRSHRRVGSTDKQTDKKPKEQEQEQGEEELEQQANGTYNVHEKDKRTERSLITQVLCCLPALPPCTHTHTASAFRQEREGERGRGDRQTQRATKDL